MRAPPQPLYSQVLDLALAITTATERGDEEGAAEALSALREFYGEHAAAGTSDPFLTETMADYEDMPAVRAQLYRAALVQAEAYSDEPRYTKQIGLAECLIDLGQFAEARLILEEARSFASKVGDDVQTSQADTLLSRVAV